jgi:hypothetical protein
MGQRQLGSISLDTMRNTLSPHAGTDQADATKGMRWPPNSYHAREFQRWCFVDTI